MAKGPKKVKKRYKVRLQRDESLTTAMGRHGTKYLFSKDWKYRWAYSKPQAVRLFRRAFPGREILEGPFLDN